jgi:hypothetical protein
MHLTILKHPPARDTGFPCTKSGCRFFANLNCQCQLLALLQQDLVSNPTKYKQKQSMRLGKQAAITP